MDLCYLSKYLDVVRKRHPDAKCVCLKTKLNLPYTLVSPWALDWSKNGKTWMGSYLRIYFDGSVGVKFFLLDVNAVELYQSKFKDLECTLEGFIKEIDNLLLFGGEWKWIPVNKVSDRYKVLWGGGQIQKGDQELGERDEKMEYPVDDDAKF